MKKFILLSLLVIFPHINLHALSQKEMDPTTFTNEKKPKSPPQSQEKVGEGSKMFGFSLFVEGGGTLILQNHRYDKGIGYSFIYGGVVEGGIMIDFLRYLYLSTSVGLSSLPDDKVLNAAFGFRIPPAYLYIGGGVQAPFSIFTHKLYGNTGITGNPIGLNPFVELLFDIPLFGKFMDITLSTRYHFIPYIREYDGALEVQAGLKFNLV